jgi:Ca2+/Na+ antiporter
MSSLRALASMAALFVAMLFLVNGEGDATTTTTTATTTAAPATSAACKKTEPELVCKLGCAAKKWKDEGKDEDSFDGNYPGGGIMGFGPPVFIDPEGMSVAQVMWAGVCYGYILYFSANMIGDGAELLLLVPKYKGLVGTVVLPVLGAVPDGMMVLFSGMGDKFVAQENVAIGVGALAGSTIMLLTLPWVLSVFGGKVDMDENGATGYAKPAKSRDTSTSFFHSVMHQGIEFLDGVSKNANIMVLTSMAYFVIQIPAFFFDDQKADGSHYKKADGSLDKKAFHTAVDEEGAKEKIFALIGAAVTGIMFLAYLYLQYKGAQHHDEPAPTEGGVVATPYSGMMSNFVPAKPSIPDGLITSKGLALYINEYREQFRLQKQGVSIAYNAPLLQAERKKGASCLPMDIQKALASLYSAEAAKSDGKGLHKADMRSALHQVGLKYSPEEFDKLWTKADDDKSGQLDKSEFVMFFDSIVKSDNPLPWETSGGGGDDDDDDEEEMPDEFKDLTPEQQQKAIIKSSFKQMIIGTCLVLIFTDPMVDVLGQLGVITKIPPFYVSFVLAPLASNASELLTSYKLACKKTKDSITSSLQALEGAACMNNSFCLFIFYMLIYKQGLAWKYTAETLAIVIVQIIVFFVVKLGSKQKVLYGFIVFLLYPLSLVFVSLVESLGYD